MKEIMSNERRGTMEAYREWRQMQGFIISESWPHSSLHSSYMSFTVESTAVQLIKHAHSQKNTHSFPPLLKTMDRLPDINNYNLNQFLLFLSAAYKSLVNWCMLLGVTDPVGKTCLVMPLKEWLIFLNSDITCQSITSKNSQILNKIIRLKN